MPEQRKPKLEWLQALRGLAAMMVLLYHLSVQWDKQPFLSALVPVTKWGFSGVDVFFVLSGFVVTMTAETLLGRGDALRFFARRAIRIYFGYWPALLVTVLVFVALLGTHYDADQRMFSSLFLFSFWPEEHWLGTAWSLTFELYFYVGIALLVYSCRPDKRQTVLAVALLLVAIWNASLMFAMKPAFVGGVQPLRMWMSAYIMEFIAGALLAYNRQHIKWNPVLALTAISLVALCAAVGSFSEWFDRIELLRVGTFGIAAVGLVWVTLMLQSNANCRAPYWLIAVGDASYSLYLLHPALVLLLQYGLNNIGATSQIGNLLLQSLLPIFCIALAIAWYRLIEHPLYRWGTRTLASKTPTV